ncbi:hypothetical protein T552_02793 [Pneumocystis carinii B80]|uniref:Chromatin modification-related protein n=1 Tax=Pneumocystis carinii (strain B80) TaxID=1408658 RepID=A0A0W4ZEJ8_PNEC8|nr:hypothetical protein T552_02793 [Pneumocystis carinii B80]KTW26792.1 hypothetical protein T552_02793 [Pneumocystis carinii B80]
MEDAAFVLLEYLNSLDNLPSEIAHIYDELKSKELKFQKIHKRICTRDNSIHKHIRSFGSLVVNPKEAQYIPKIQADFIYAIKIQEEKLFLSRKSLDLLQRHLRRLDNEIKRLHLDGQIAPETTKNIYPPFYTLTSESRTLVIPRKRRALSIRMSDSDPDSISNDNDDSQVYCFCQQISYGEMIACDDSECVFEWFHYGCVGLKAPPNGKWFCSDTCKTRSLKKKDKYSAYN